MSQILIAEDEARIASFIAKGLRAAGFAPIVVGTGHEAFDLARTGEFDLLVLDLGTCATRWAPTAWKPCAGWAIGWSIPRPERPEPSM